MSVHISHTYLYFVSVQYSKNYMFMKLLISLANLKTSWIYQ